MLFHCWRGRCKRLTVYTRPMLTTETHDFDLLFYHGLFKRSVYMARLGLPEYWCKNLCGIRFCLLNGKPPLATLSLGYAHDGKFYEVVLEPRPLLLVHTWERPADPYDAVDNVLGLNPSDTLRQLLLASLVAPEDPELMAYLSAAGYRP